MQIFKSLHSRNQIKSETKFKYKFILLDEFHHMNLIIFLLELLYYKLH